MRFLTWMFIARTSRISPDIGYTAKIQILKQITTLSNNIARNKLMSVAPHIYIYIKNVFTKKLHKYTFSAKTSNISLNINAIGAVYIRCTSGVLSKVHQAESSVFYCLLPHIFAAGMSRRLKEWRKSMGIKLHIH